MFVQYLLTTHVVWCSHRRLSGYATLQCIAADSERESLCQCHPHSSCSVKQMGFYRKTKKEKKFLYCIASTVSVRAFAWSACCNLFLIGTGCHVSRSHRRVFKLHVHRGFHPKPGLVGIVASSSLAWWVLLCHQGWFDGYCSVIKPGLVGLLRHQGWKANICVSSRECKRHCM